MNNAADIFMLSLCLWREARGDGDAGMTAVGCVVRNRVHRRNSSFYAEVVRRLQFSSITATGDPQLIVYPQALDAAWVKAQLLAAGIINGSIADTTEGSTLYYANSIPFPKDWNKAVLTATVTVGNQFFFRENG